MSAPRASVLRAEHELLGAAFDEGAHGTQRVSRYPREGAPAGGALLCDLTGATYLLLSGPDASALAEAALCGRALAVGEAAFEGALTGDGALLSAPLVMRTGDGEYALLDPSPHGEALEAWLGFLAGVERGGVRPFGSASIEGAAEMLVPLLLAGPAARAVLADYVASADELPRPGRVASLRLDAIPALVCCPPAAGGGADALVVLVPPARARTLWRSLLSFTEVEPVGHARLAGLLADALPWAAALGGSGPARAGRRELGAWGLLREGGGFVGERGLASS